ncbi:hypothetical protein V6N12_050761 [Hibiscus sabdariffa]|uniref:Uncharacterized protein n=1 Tax=Hibiscus sabdariffa TaxID=183260 RepID=A0ABR2GEH9_9ROSI
MALKLTVSEVSSKSNPGHMVRNEGSTAGPSLTSICDVSPTHITSHRFIGHSSPHSTEEFQQFVSNNITSNNFALLLKVILLL